MSLRVRLVILVVALVTLVAVAYSALYLDSLVNSLSADALERSELASQQVNAFIIDRINLHSELYETPANLEETKALWNMIVASERDISAMLEKTMALSPTIVEINIAGQTGEVLASSNPSRIGGALAQLEALSRWRSGPLSRRLLDLATRRADYHVTVPLGITSQGRTEPIFTIQVVASGVLLRGALLPQVQTLAAVSGGALLVSLILTLLSTNRVLRPLKRIEQTIDRIVQGNFRGDESRGELAKEFAVVESKLNLLGQQFRGAREDASELKHNLDQLVERMASQLDVASRLAAISRITSGVAHEIKNPLNAIALRLDLLRARLGAPEEELAPEIDVLSKEVMRLDRVVKTFLDFSRPVEVKFTDVDLTAIAREVTDLMAPQARLARIALRFEAPAEAAGPALIRGDEDLLKQAILNLVNNALEAMKNGGNLQVSVSQAGGAVTLMVTDDGPGIPPELSSKVFQLYFTTKSRGSGIGLAMTYRAMQLHNGTIDFASESGRGTAFRLQFPALVRHV
jgi:signal transduction histidine kinase